MAQRREVVEIGQVRTLFRMPDLISIGLGGGTVVDPIDPFTAYVSFSGFSAGSDNLGHVFRTKDRGDALQLR